VRVKKKNNKGFTLIELIVALAIMAFVMVIVCSLMAQYSLSYRKTKAELAVQNTALATYDELSDSIMQATSISIEGYSASKTIEFTLDELDSEKTSDASLTAIKCLKASDIAAKPTGEQSDYTDYTAATGEIYLTKMVITYSVPLEKASLSGSVAEGTRVRTTWDDVNETYVEGNVPTYVITTAAGDTVTLDQDGVDTCTVTYLFDGKNMYVGRTYKYMAKKNDMWTGSTTDLSPWLYTSSLNYAVCGSNTVSGVVATVNASNGAIGLNLSFASNRMSYNTDGLVNIRNSYVLKDAK
jgi:prepilin-type N-terminal cleavage/methylation domain-containing protein